jgi:hypothetical protein
LATVRRSPAGATVRSRFAFEPRLPNPAGAFRPLPRVYEPDDAIFDGTYELPPITRIT